jgi:hypothetical protein
MATPLQPNFAVHLTIPRDSGDTTPRYSTQPFADAVFTEGRVAPNGWEGVHRAVSDEQGQPSMATGGVVLNDDDGVLRTAIAENPTRFTSKSTANLVVLSEAGRRAGLDWRFLMRGRVGQPTFPIERNGLQRKRRVQLSITDALAPYYDRMIPNVPFTRENFSDIHADLVNTMIPLVGGEHSDAGAVSISGASAEKGQIPAIHAGTYRTVYDINAVPAYLAPPTISAAVIGTPGTTQYSYAWTSLSAYGQTVLGGIVTVTNGPDVLDGTNYIQLTRTSAVHADEVGVIVYGRRNVTPVRRLKQLAAGTIYYNDSGVDPEYTPAPPTINTAQINAADGGFFWDLYVLCLGVMEPGWRIYGSNVAPGVEPARQLFTTDMYGVDVLHPEGPDWPFPDPWIVLPDGTWVTGFLARGPRSQHHIDGIVTMAVNGCGYEDVGDGTGQAILQYFPLRQHFLNEFVLKDEGKGYRSGLWGPLEEYPDGQVILDTISFTEAQDLSKLFLDNDEGYMGKFYLRETVTVREFLQMGHATVDSFGGTDHFGRYFEKLYNPYGSETAGRVFREKIEVMRLEPPVLDESNLEPRIFIQYDYDPDADRYRSEVEKIEDAAAYDMQKHKVRDRGTLLKRFTGDAATARDSAGRRVQRLKLPRWRQAMVVRPTPGFEVELFDQMLLTHRDCADGAGWTDRPCLAIAHDVDQNSKEVVIDTYDLLPVLESTALLGDETAQPELLGDETDVGQPAMGGG